MSAVVDRAEPGPASRSATLRTLAVALGLAAAGVAVKALLVHGLQLDPFYLIYFPAIALSAWAGGAWQGSLTTLVAGAVDASVFQEPSIAGRIADPDAVVRLALFVVAGGIVSALTGMLLSARTSAEASRAQLVVTAQREEQARRRAEHTAERLGAMRAVVTALAGAVTPHDVADAVLRGAIETLGIRAGAVALPTADGEALESIALIGYRPEVVERIGRIPLDARLPAADVARTRQPLFLGTDEALRERYPALPQDPDDRSEGALAVLPLTVDERFVGVMWYRFSEARPFDADDRGVITALAQQCAQALERARLFASEREARTEALTGQQRIALLAEASALLGASPDYDATLPRVARLLATELATWCSIDLLDERGGLRPAAFAHRDPEREPAERTSRDRDPVAPGDGSWIARALATGVTVVEQRSRWSSAAVPIASPRGSIGVITVAATGNDPVIGRREVAFVEDLARRIATSVENARLYRQLDQFKGTVDASLDAVFIFDPTSLRYSYVNQGAVAQLGYSRDELLGMRALDIEPNFDEDAYRELIATLTGGGRSHTFTTVHRRRDGTEVPVEVFLQAVQLPAGEVSMVANARDISERIEGQARLYRLARAERSRAAELNAVLQAMGEAILVCDSDGAVLLANRAAERLFGDLPRDHAELAGRLRGAQAKLPPLGVEAGPLEMRLVGAREDRWIELTTYSVALEASGADRRSAAQTTVATILVMRDVTEVREAQALRETFLGVLSHELRTPITTIYGTTKVLARPSAALDPELRTELIADIGAEADRLYRIVEDLVVLSRAETGIEIEGEPLLLRHLIPSVVASERQRWPSTRFDISLPGWLPTVRADATYVEQVLRNLLGNAAKYSPAPAEVAISAETQDEEVLVRVLDRGVGIETDEVSRLFDLFYRSPTSTARARGAGIGLWVCRRLVEGMGGRIWAAPRDGGGSEFGFSLKTFVESDLG